MNRQIFKSIEDLIRKLLPNGSVILFDSQACRDAGMTSIAPLIYAWEETGAGQAILLQ